MILGKMTLDLSREFICACLDGGQNNLQEAINSFCTEILNNINYEGVPLQKTQDYTLNIDLSDGINIPKGNPPKTKMELLLKDVLFEE